MPGLIPCAKCENLIFLGRGSRPDPVCRPCRKEAKKTTCAKCRKIFYKARPTHTTQHCSRACSIRYTPEERQQRQNESWQRKNRRRRAALRGLTSQPYVLSEIAERDKYVCGLCSDSVDMRLKHPHPGSPSIDHVTPLSKGGHDTPDNVQLAHLRCNSVKGNREGLNLAA